MKDGKRNNLGNCKVEKQTVVYGKYQQQKLVPRATYLASEGRLWNDDDFKCCNMDEKFQPLLDALESIKTCDDNKERVLGIGRKVGRLILSNLREIKYWRPGYAGSMEVFNGLTPTLGM